MPHRAFDHLSVRCPKLGGTVTFSYCRTLDDGLPCNRALVCFERVFPVGQYFVRVLREQTFRRIFIEGTAKPDRVTQLLDEVALARERVEKE